MGAEKRALQPLKTPKTTVYPSELFSDPSTLSSDTAKRRNDLSIPITPPTAYIEFLKILTPVFDSSADASMDFPSFRSSYADKPVNPVAPASQPPSASAIASSFSHRESDKLVLRTAASLPTPESATTTCISSRANDGAEGAHLRRLHIPQTSPLIQAPRSATTIRSSFSPADWKDWRTRQLEAPRSATWKPVSVREVVTRTVTYKRTQLEDPPKGKRRKCNDGLSKDT